jgi:hypothetical protein
LRERSVRREAAVEAGTHRTFVFGRLARQTIRFPSHEQHGDMGSANSVLTSVGRPGALNDRRTMSALRSMSLLATTDVSSGIHFARYQPTHKVFCSFFRRSKTRISWRRSTVLTQNAILVPSGESRRWRPRLIADSRWPTPGCQSSQERSVLRSGASRVDHSAKLSRVALQDRDRVEPEARKNQRPVQPVLIE